MHCTEHFTGTQTHTYTTDRASSLSTDAGRDGIGSPNQSNLVGHVPVPSTAEPRHLTCSAYEVKGFASLLGTTTAAVTAAVGVRVGAAELVAAAATSSCQSVRNHSSSWNTHWA